ncbi:MAG: ECF transporter S component [Ruminococcaceae bacterium]|nr:ECF transporter S component [Oscillospiraceae bacterium]
MNCTIWTVSEVIFMTNERRTNTQKLVLGAIFTALVVILQLMGSFIRFGTFSVSLVLIPIVLGAATCGVAIGAWLGFAFGIAVLLSGDAAVFLAISVPGTVTTVLLKGLACGLIAGLVYKFLAKFNQYLAIIAAAIVCPIVNTGVFLLGCSIFFLDTINLWAITSSVKYENTFAYMILGLVGGNFIFELIFNVVLSPVIVRVLSFERKLKA